MSWIRLVSIGVLSAMVWACARPSAEPSIPAGNALLPSLQAYTSGGEVGFVLQITNTTDRPLDLNFTSGQSYDFIVSREGQEVWRWSGDQMFTQALRRERLAAGESLRYEASWRPATTLRGEFLVTGVLTSSDHRVEQSTRFVLP